LDRATGEVISATFSGAEFTPKGRQKPFSKRAQDLLALASVSSFSEFLHFGVDTAQTKRKIFRIPDERT